MACCPLNRKRIGCCPVKAISILLSRMIARAHSAVRQRNALDEMLTLDDDQRNGALVSSAGICGSGWRIARSTEVRQRPRHGCCCDARSHGCCRSAILPKRSQSLNGRWLSPRQRPRLVCCCDARSHGCSFSFLNLTGRRLSQRQRPRHGCCCDARWSDMVAQFSFLNLTGRRLSQRQRPRHGCCCDTR